ncbi:MAG TPA: type VI secretion system baseplate subunit TssG [Limnobacter sp.]|nr:type VI secretion system baseplate subunit TssG [Limnobacter sp.]
MIPLLKRNPDQPEPPAGHFFALLQQIEHQHAERVSLGSSFRLRDDPVRLGQHPHLDFATRDVKRVAWIPTLNQGQVQKLYVQNFGMLGPNGALPLHYTEHACNRLQQWNDPTFSEFLDIFHHRSYLLFYRAWAYAQPSVAYHGRQGNSFTRHLSSLTGCAFQTLQEREHLPATFRARLAGHFSRRTKTEEGLVSILAACTGQQVRVLPFRARWLKLDHPDEPAALGAGAMLGSRSWSALGGIQVHIGPMAYEAYLGLLPGCLARQQLLQAVHAYLGFEFDCEFMLQIKSTEVPQACLNGQLQLGRTAWLGNPHRAGQFGRLGMVRIKCS